MNQVFEQNPQLKKVFMTSDGTPFYTENDAYNHAKTLDDKTVEPVFNPNHLEAVADEDNDTSAAEMEEFLKTSTDAPATDVPATDAPATDAPATDAPVTDAPATDAPATDAPAEEPTLIVTTEKSGTVDLMPLTKANLLAFSKTNDLTVADPKATNAALREEIVSQLKDKA